MFRPRLWTLSEFHDLHRWLSAGTHDVSVASWVRFKNCGFAEHHLVSKKSQQYLSNGAGILLLPFHFTKCTLVQFCPFTYSHFAQSLPPSGTTIPTLWSLGYEIALWLLCLRRTAISLLLLFIGFFQQGTLFKEHRASTRRHDSFLHWPDKPEPPRPPAQLTGGQGKADDHRFILPHLPGPRWKAHHPITSLQCSASTPHQDSDPQVAASGTLPLARAA